MQENGLLHPEDAFVVGCPAGWNAATRARYRELLTRAGLREPQVISESRAAFLYAKYAKTVALDIDVLSKTRWSSISAAPRWILPTLSAAGKRASAPSGILPWAAAFWMKSCSACA